MRPRDTSETITTSLYCCAGGQGTFRVIIFQVGPGPHVLGCESLLDPVVQELAQEQALVQEQAEALADPLEVPREDPVVVLELREVQVRHDGVHLRGVIARSEH